jgi:hypothetical protein
MHIKTLNLVTAALLLPLIAGLSGCDREAASASTSAPPSTPALQRHAYKLVTQHRPVSLEAYHAMGKAAYDMCVVLARQQQVPVQPFVRIPPDFVAQRATMQSDGVSYYAKVESYELNIDSITPQEGCATRIVHHVAVDRIGNGKIEQLGRVGDGPAETESRPDDTPPANDADKTDDLAPYTVARKENGIALTCLPPGAAVLQVGLGTDMCVVDAGGGRTVRSSNGDALVAYARITSVDTLRGVIMLEPVSLQLGKADPEVFSGPLK